MFEARRFRLAAALACAVAMAAQADPEVEARAHLTACTSCHGEDGQGVRARNAPRIAGQRADYLERQLQAFHDGWRGTRAGDVTGRQMNLIAAPIVDPAVRAVLAAHFAAASAPPPAQTLVGDAVRGAALYAPCAACHGTRGEGGAIPGAPRLAGIDDWYLLRQLRNYRDGLRGYHAGDAAGAQMVAQVRTLGDDRDLLDLVAAIGELAAGR